ncbi:hypothetical protein FB45DRAFT_1078011 [Roridomyces roridus]|uniref:BTB domain-containing protein n=1 Tax=Roridomyces roridus TaxID=1738132 RepID=A0AAD7FYY4_9AGAR|nr:hypothetical protein FB45DRAFT_1078011 [Roridomyces roridus]
MSGPDPDNESPLPLKRQRTENKDRRDFVRSKIWKPYGDIVLLAESTLFKVNRTNLVEHSSVFEGMFSIPQHPEVETIDGCAVVELSDTAQDVELLLTAFYNPFHHQPKQPFEVVACMLRLGRKYEIDKFKDDAVSRIRHAFPGLDEVWDTKRDIERIEPRTGLVVDLLNLAHETGLKTCIPTLALRCLEVWTLRDLFKGIVRRDGSRAILNDALKLMLAVASEAIRGAQVQFFKTIPTESRCKFYCGVAPRTFYVYGYSSRVRPVRSVAADESYTTGVVFHQNISGGSPLLAETVIGRCNLCEKCASAREGAYKSELWEKLPGPFGLPEWKDLKDSV